MRREPHFIIAGHGRSGTHYMAELMSAFGFDVPCHSGPGGKNGVCNHRTIYDPTANNPAYKTDTNAKITVGCSECGAGKDPKRLFYDHDPDTILIHEVRNPWKVIQSNYYLPGRPSDFISNVRPEVRSRNLLETSIKSVVLWNKEIAGYSPDLTIQVENAQDTMRAWLAGLKLIDREMCITYPPKNVYMLPHDTLSFDDYGDVDPPVMDMLFKHCREYGYEEKP